MRQKKEERSSRRLNFDENTMNSLYDSWQKFYDVDERVQGSFYESKISEINADSGDTADCCTALARAGVAGCKMDCAWVGKL